MLYTTDRWFLWRKWQTQIEINEQYNNNNEYKLERPEPAKNENELNPVEPPTQDPSFVDNENEQLTSTPVTNQLVSPIISDRPNRNRHPPKYLEDHET